MEKGKSMPLDTRKVTVDELAPGMVLADDVYSQSGVKLLPKGVRLQEHMIEILAHRSRKDPIVGGVHVYRGSNTKSPSFIHLCGYGHPKIIRFLLTLPLLSPVQSRHAPTGPARCT